MRERDRWQKVRGERGWAERGWGRVSEAQGGGGGQARAPRRRARARATRLRAAAAGRGGRRQMQRAGRDGLLAHPRVAFERLEAKVVGQRLERRRAQRRLEAAAAAILAGRRRVGWGRRGAGQHKDDGVDDAVVAPWRVGHRIYYLWCASSKRRGH